MTSARSGHEGAGIEGSGRTDASDPPVPGGVHGLVEVMDRLRSPGGCPWDAQQTHDTLARFAVEEAYELADAIASGSREDIADELGDVLFQVVFHARLGQEWTDAEGGPFGIDDVADRVTAKLRRRHPHVFGDVATDDPARIEANWDAVKALEKPERTSPLDGIPASLAPLERAAKIATRYRRAGRLDEVEQAARSAEGDEHDYGRRLFELVCEAVGAGADPGTELTHAVQQATTTLREEERGLRPHRSSGPVND